MTTPAPIPPDGDLERLTEAEDYSIDPPPETGVPPDELARAAVATIHDQAMVIKRMTVTLKQLRAVVGRMQQKIERMDAALHMAVEQIKSQRDER